MRAWTFLALVACAPRAIPEAAPPPAPAPANEDHCISARARAQVEACTAQPPPTHAEVLSALDAADRAFVARPPRVPEDAGAPKRKSEQRAEERRLLAPMPLLPEQDFAVEVLHRWICAHPGDLEATHRLARLHFEHHRFEEAAVLFARVAAGPAEQELPVVAFERWLESVNVLGTFFAATSCFDDMVAQVPAARDRLCAFELMARDPARVTVCTWIGRINADIDRLQMQRGLDPSRSRDP